MAPVLEQNRLQTAQTVVPPDANMEGWGSIADLQRALEQNGEDPLVQDARGVWVRQVPSYDGTFDKDGVKVHRRIWTNRRIALTMGECQALFLKGDEADYYSGRSLGWIRRGIKAERDFATYTHEQARVVEREEFVAAGDEEQAAYRTEQEIRRGERLLPPMSEAARVMVSPTAKPVVRKEP